LKVASLVRWSDFIQALVSMIHCHRPAGGSLLPHPQHCNPQGASMKRTLALATVFAFLAACQAIPLQPGAAQVRLTNEEPQGCKFLGDITGNQGNALTGGFTSNRTLETGARNDIKNQAKAMGGNVVYLLTNRAGQTGSFGAGSGGSEQTNVTLSGNVYECPEG
jgi:hypothetical protein